MTIREEKQLKNYIKNLVRESIYSDDAGDLMGMYDGEDGPTNEPDWDEDELDVEDAFWYEHDHPESRRSHYEGPDVTGNDDVDYNDEPAGLDELKRVCEGFARSAVRNILSEGKKKKPGKKKSKKDKKKSDKTTTILNRLNSKGVNSAQYFYKLYGVENGTDEQKASARSKGYKKAKGKKNDTGIPYKFSSKEVNRLSSMLTDKQ